MHRRLFGWLGPSYVLQNWEMIPLDSCRMYARIHSKISMTLYEDIKKHRSFSVFFRREGGGGRRFKGKGARINNLHQSGGVHGNSFRTQFRYSILSCPISSIPSQKSCKKKKANFSKQLHRPAPYFLYHMRVIFVFLIFFCSWNTPYSSASGVGGHPGT